MARTLGEGVVDEEVEDEVDDEVDTSVEVDIAVDVEGSEGSKDEVVGIEEEASDIVDVELGASGVSLGSGLIVRYRLSKAMVTGSGFEPEQVR